MKKLLILIILIFTASALCASQFTDEMEKAYKKAGNAGALKGKNDYCFLKSELHFLSQGVFWGANAAKASVAKDNVADPMPAIVDFNNQLKKKGIELIVLPVPAKASIYPEMISDFTAAAKNRGDKACESFYAQLKSKGIKVLDVAPAFLAAKSNGNLYCKTDSHWAAGGMNLAAKAVLGAVKEKAWYKAAKKTNYTASAKTIEISGDIRAMLNNAVPKEKVKINTVSGAVSVKSPILLMGDSHTLIFHGGGDMLAVNSGFAEALAVSLKMPVDLLGVKGSGATPVRISLMRKPNTLNGKKVVIWCFASREFTESAQGWALVPVVK